MVDGFGHKYAGIMNAIDQRLGDTQDTIDTLGSTYFGAGGEGFPSGSFPPMFLAYVG